LPGQFDTVEEKRQLIERMDRYFAKETKVAEQALRKLRSLGSTR